MRIKSSLFLSLLLSAFVFTPAFSQTWCPPGAKWHYEFICMSCNGYQEMVYEKDTVVDQVPCKKILTTLYGHAFSSQQVDTIIQPPVYTYMQNDTVFVYCNQQFEPIYFFDADVGDTLISVNYMLPYSAFPCSDSLLIEVVDSAGIIIVNSDTLHYYVARPIDSVFAYSIRIVERMGAVNDHFVPYRACGMESDGYWFRCYEDNSFPVYTEYPSFDCDYIYIGREDEIVLSLDIFPNPCQNRLFIESDFQKPCNGILEIISSEGRIVRSEIFETTGRMLRMNLNVESIECGIYQLTLRSGDFLISRKFVVSGN